MDDEIPLKKSPPLLAIHLFAFFAATSLLLNKPFEGHLPQKPDLGDLLISSHIRADPMPFPAERHRLQPIVSNIKTIGPLPLLDTGEEVGKNSLIASHLSNGRTTDATHEPYYGIIAQAAALYDVDPALIKAIIMAESNYNPNAVSKRGARGLMQLMPATAESLGVKNSFDPHDNIHGGVRYFRQLLDRFNGDIKLALAAYNAGSRYVRKYQGIPPFSATKRYIQKVFRYHSLYQSGT